jgi:uncharacterized RDD family membrane protein YckC
VSSEITWYYESAAGRMLGPVSTESLQEVFAAGSLPLSTPVMAAATGQWVAARMIPEFRKAAPAEVSEPSPASPLSPPPLPAYELEYATPGIAAVARDPQTPSLGARWFARQIDHVVLVGPMVLLLYAMVACCGENVSPLLWILRCVIARLFLEAALLAWYGQTPGKKALGIRLETADRTRPSFIQALQRASLVLVGGEGLGLPGIGLVTQLVAYGMARGEGVSFWDRQLELRLRRCPPAAGRVLGVPVLMIGAVIVGGVVFLELFAAANRHVQVEPAPWAVNKRMAERQEQRKLEAMLERDCAAALAHPIVTNAVTTSITDHPEWARGEWRRPVPFLAPNAVEVMVFNADGTFRGYYRTGEDALTGPTNGLTRRYFQKPRAPGPSGDWAGTWQLDTRSFTLKVNAASFEKMKGTWRLELLELEPDRLELQPMTLPSGVPVPPHHEQDVWTFVRPPSAPAVAHTE